MAGDQVITKKESFLTEEKKEAFPEKATEDQEEFWLQDAKDAKIDDEKFVLDEAHFEETDEIDIAIVNEVTITEDDPELLCFTIRSFIIGIVCIALSKYDMTYTNDLLLTIAPFSSFILCLSANDVQASWCCFVKRVFVDCSLCFLYCLVQISS